MTFRSCLLATVSTRCISPIIRYEREVNIAKCDSLNQVTDNGLYGLEDIVRTYCTFIKLC